MNKHKLRLKIKDEIYYINLEICVIKKQNKKYYITTNINQTFIVSQTDNPEEYLFIFDYLLSFKPIVI